MDKDGLQIDSQRLLPVQPYTIKNLDMQKVDSANNYTEVPLGGGGSSSNK
jgi:hypothetical protein